MGFVRKKYARKVRRFAREVRGDGHLAGCPLFSPREVEFAPGSLFWRVSEMLYGTEGPNVEELFSAETIDDRIPEGACFIRAFNTVRPWRGKRRTVLVCAVPTGNCDITIRCYHRPYEPAVESLNVLTSTAVSLFGQTTVAEHKALRLLRKLVNDMAYDEYLLSGTLHVMGESGVRYLVRKNRPIIAYRDAPKSETGITPNVLCGLCLHPLGYYRGSFAGVMCPTDEVIAQILLIRGDERFLWRKVAKGSPASPDRPVKRPRNLTEHRQRRIEPYGTSHTVSFFVEFPTAGILLMGAYHTLMGA